MSVLEPHAMTAGEATRAMAGKQIVPSQLLEACLARIDAVEPRVQGWIHLAREEARMHARLRDAQGPGSALYGIPIGIKDIIEAAGLPMGCGSPIFDNNLSRRDAACVALLKEAGAVSLGKTVTTELAHFHPGKTRNPHNPAHTPGGSSQGSAAAVAAGMVPLAVGTQTGGSVIRPAGAVRCRHPWGTGCSAALC